MGGMKNEGKFLIVLVLATVFFLSACGRHKIPLEKPSPPPEKKGVYHVVERHQTLYRICKTYGIAINEVSSFNGITDPGKIQTGQRIFIPGAKMVLKVEIVIDDVVAEPVRGEKVGYNKLDFFWPVNGKLGNGFEGAENRRHQGIDISSPLGTPVKSSNAGTVIYAGNTIKGYGNLIILRHPEEFVTVYAHNHINMVEEGAWVERGQIIGKVGQTGRASGPHLHFEIRKNNKAVDPLIFLK